MRNLRTTRQEPMSGSRKFNLTKCGCEESCPDVKCENGGILNNETCTCDCAPGWEAILAMNLLTDRQKYLRLYLKSCASCATREFKQCKYWINPTGTNPGENAFQVMCDMEGDGGGWIEIANIGETMRKMQIYKDNIKKVIKRRTLS